MYYLIGEKLKHSYSKEIHCKAGYTYELKELNKNELGSFLSEKNFEGLNVTIPFKEAVMPYLDYLSPLGKMVGAINTIVNVNGKLLGFNTDVLGIIKSLENVDLKGKKVLILGSGGASKAANIAVKKKGGIAVIISRTGEDNYQNLFKHNDAKFIINATPVGMYPKVEDKPLSLSQFTSLEGVFDLIYNPSNTELILEAKALKLWAKSGLDMLLWQAVASEMLFEAKSDKVNEESLKLVKKPKLNTKNIALIGMPFSGKTTVGIKLAKELKYDFVDLDKEIEKQGESIENLILRGQFREIESNVLKQFSSLSHTVISTGGGIVLKEENIKELKRNSDIVLIERNIMPSNFEGRPLTKNQKEYALIKNERAKLYEMASDFKVENNDTVSVAVKEIINKLGLEDK